MCITHSIPIETFSFGVPFMTKKYKVHEGDDVVVLGPDDTTDNATATFRNADDARKFVKAANAHSELVSAARAVHRSAVPLDDEGTSFSISRKAIEKTTAVLVKLEVMKSDRLPGAPKGNGGVR